MADGHVRIEAILDIDKASEGIDGLQKQTEGLGKSEPFKPLGKSADTLGKNLIGVGGTLTKGVTAPILGVGAALGGIVTKWTVGGGISRALNIEDAQAKLRGLGHDTESVENIMDSALASVKGTAFGMDEAASAAASAVAAGVEPGEDLTRVLSLTADAATIMGRDFGDAGSIVNKVLARGKIGMEEVNQLTDAGLPILQMLADEYGVTAEELTAMVSRGEVDSTRFMNALENNVGGAALSSGDTTRGAFANMQAAFARVGAAVAEDVAPKLKELFGQITEWVDENGSKISDFALGVVDAFTWLVDSGLMPFVLALVGVAAAIGPILMAIGKFMTILPTLQAGLTAVRGAFAAVNAVMAANPIGVVIAIIAVLIGVVIHLWNTNEDFRNAVIAIWEAIKGAISAAVEWIGEKLDAFKEWLGSVGEKAGQLKDDISGKWEEIKTATGEKWESVKSTISGKWDEIKSSVSSKAAQVSSDLTSKWNSIKGTATGVWNGIKFAIENPMQAAQLAATGVNNIMERLLGDKWRSIRNTATSVFNGVKNAITNPIETAKNTVRRIVDTIKGFFSGLNLRIPSIKLPRLPRFTISGKFGFNPPSVPRLGINWYAKGGIFNAPSIIGVGEAGKEAVVPLSGSAMRPFADAIARAQGGSGGGSVEQNITIHAYINNDLDIDNVIDQLTRKLKRNGGALA